MSTHPDAPRIEQANEVAGIVITVTEKVHPGEFVTLDLRYGIADALWAAGYRKVEGEGVRGWGECGYVKADYLSPWDEERGHKPFDLVCSLKTGHVGYHRDSREGAFGPSVAAALGGDDK